MPSTDFVDEKFHKSMMAYAIAQAHEAWRQGEVPVGAVLTSADGDIIASACNRTIQLLDPTGHAEILAIRKAARLTGNYRLLNTTLYVTVEPCFMCMGALIHARIKRVVFGASDIKWGAAGSLYNFATDQRLNHQIEIIGGICGAECRQMMQEFFRDRRKRNKLKRGKPEKGINFEK